MGTEYCATCGHCGTAFPASEGGGFDFHLLHCDRCGRERSVSREQMGEAFAGEGEAREAWIRRHVPACHCGGSFTLEARARCPNCKRDDWDPGKSQALIDYD